MSPESPYDLLIVGAGPGGLSAGFAARKNKLNCIILEKADHISDTIFCYQKGKFVMAEPTPIPLRGDMYLTPTKRETLLAEWEKTGSNLAIEYNNAVTGICKIEGIFHVTSAEKTFYAKNVVIATGSQGFPRKLGVPGDDLPHVLPRLDDPADYVNQDIVIVGGGDAGIEIVLALADQNRVSLVVKTPELAPNVKDANRQKVLERAKRKELTIYFGASTVKIDSDTITLDLAQSDDITIPAQVIIVKVGTISPKPFLEKCGITFPQVLTKSYETNVPGLFLIGAANGRELIKHAMNQGYEVVEHLCGREFEPADEQVLRDKHKITKGSVSDKIKELMAKAPLLAGVTEEQIREMLLLSTFHKKGAGEIIFRQNDFSETLYIVLSGSLECSLKEDTGKERVVATIRAGQFLGEMSLISGRRRSATVKAATDVTLWEIGRNAMLNCINQSPALKKTIDGTFITRAFQHYFSNKLTPDALRQLTQNAKFKEVKKGQSIIQEGTAGETFYFLRSGIVKVSRRKDDKDVALAYLHAGKYFGEMALLSDKPRAASVFAVGKVEVIEVSKKDFLACVELSSELKDSLLKEVNERELENIKSQFAPETSVLKDFMVKEEVVVGDNVLIINEGLCVDCDNCVKACQSVHQDGQTRIKRVGISFLNILVPNSCRHCENPLCMTNCPPGDAIVRAPNGEVYIKPDVCIGCGNCASNCPYNNIFMTHEEEKFSLTRWITDILPTSIRPAAPKKEEKSLAVKCDLCRGVDGGPACVRGCPTGALLRLKPAEYMEKLSAIARRD
ncbi:MAG: cyclic nucleotide-binding domain-containing protein [Nitrospirota bacterium]